MHRTAKGAIALCLGVAAGTSACGDVSPTGGNGNGGIPPTPLTVEVSLDAADAELASLLGSPNGRVPGAEVRVERETIGEIEDPWIEVTDDEGRAVFPTLFAGAYRISALKVLTSEEVAAVSAARPLVRAIGGGRRLPQGTEISLTVQANRADGMVVSEVATNQNDGSDGIWFGYVELYNNSPDVRYLDGMLIARAFHDVWGFEATQRCRPTYADDPDGVWTRLFQRFPGTGTEYPVQPGETVVLAFDAIDWSQHRPWMFDLSNADFEFRTQSDADNPAVADLIDEGPTASIQSGIQFLSGFHVPFLVEPISTTGLPEARLLQPLSDAIHVRIPTAAVIDLYEPILGQWSTGAELCGVTMNATFDRLAYVWKRRSEQHLRSEQRRSIGTAPGGWTILMDTNTSAVDFVDADRTLDAVLPPP